MLDIACEPRPALNAGVACALLLMEQEYEEYDMQATSLDPGMQQCIDQCLVCYRTCMQTAMNRCLEMGGAHVEPSHFRLMINCSEMCRTTAEFMMSSSPLHAQACAACAAVCDACAQSCEQIDGMDDCVQVCRACALSCHKMAGEEASTRVSQSMAGSPSTLQDRLPM
jgi:hypothetical protein